MTPSREHGSTSRAPAGWYADPERPGRTRYWTGEAWRDPAPPVARRVTHAFALMTAAGIALVVWGVALVPGPRTSCSEYDVTDDQWRVCRRAVCDQMELAAQSTSALSWLLWLLLVALAIAASWLGYHHVRRHAGRVRVVLGAGILAAWIAVLALVPGLLATLSVIGSCTT